MAHSENSSETLTSTRARALRVGFLGPVGDIIAKVAQTVGIPVGATLSKHDQEAIAQWYESRRKITNVASEITKPMTGDAAINAEIYLPGISTINTASEDVLLKAA